MFENNKTCILRPRHLHETPLMGYTLCYMQMPRANEKLLPETTICFYFQNVNLIL